MYPLTVSEHNIMLLNHIFNKIKAHRMLLTLISTNTPAPEKLLGFVLWNSGQTQCVPLKIWNITRTLTEQASNLLTIKILTKNGQIQLLHSLFPCA